MANKIEMLPGRPEDVTFGQKKPEREFFWYSLRKNCKVLLITLIGVLSALCVLCLVLIGIELLSPKMTWANQQKIENLQKSNTEQSKELKNLRDDLEISRDSNEKLQIELREAKQEIKTLTGTVAARDKQIERLYDKTSFQTLEEQLSSKVTWWGCFFASLVALLCAFVVIARFGSYLENFFKWLKTKIRRI